MKYLIAGLGNVGVEYANTRHNAGFVTADALVKELKGEWKVEKLASVSKVKFKGRTLVVIKPTTYMNLSGKSVKYWLEKEKIPIERLLVIVDDIGYFASPYFQDSAIAQAVDDVVADGAVYLSSAGNSSLESYEDDYNEVDVDGR